MISLQCIVRNITLGVTLAALPGAAALAQQDKGAQRPAAAAGKAEKGGSEKSGPVRVATVNGKAIFKSHVDLIVKQQASRGVQDNDQLRKAIVERLIGFELIAQEAEKKGLTRNTDVLARIYMARQELLTNAYMNDYFKAHPIKEETLRSEYNKVRSQRGDKEFKARHILVEKEAEAREILDKLGKGEKFEDLAKVSRDPGSKDKGGELDWAVAGTFVKPFADALGKLEKGKTIDAPVQSQFGFHIIRLDDVRAAPFPTFEQARGEILNGMQLQELEKITSDLRAKAKIE